jgi:hypothetical protein
MVRKSQCIQGTENLNGTRNKPRPKSQLIGAQLTRRCWRQTSHIFLQSSPERKIFSISLSQVVFFSDGSSGNGSGYKSPNQRKGMKRPNDSFRELHDRLWVPQQQEEDTTDVGSKVIGIGIGKWNTQSNGRLNGPEYVNGRKGRASLARLI